MQSEEIVINPNPGRPAFAVVTFQDIERASIEQPLQESLNRVEALNAELEAKTQERDAEVAKCESLKSSLNRFDAVAAGTESEAEPEGASGENPAFAAAA